MLERDKLGIGVESCPHDFLIKFGFGQYDFTIWPTRPSLRKASNDPVQKVSEWEDSISVICGLLENRNTNRPNPTPVVVRDLVGIGKQRGIPFGPQAMIDCFQRHRIGVRRPKVALG